METPLILLIVFIVVLVVFGLTALHKIMRSKAIYGLGWKLVLFALIFLAYFLVGYLIYLYILLPISDWLPKRDMVIWDNIWYGILAVFIMLILATIVKSVRDNRIRVGLSYFSIGTLFILILYSIIYYIFMFNESLETITFVLFIISTGLAIIMIIITRFLGIRSRLLLPLYVIFSIACMIFIICLFWLIIRAIEALDKKINGK